MLQEGLAWTTCRAWQKGTHHKEALGKCSSQSWLHGDTILAWPSREVLPCVNDKVSKCMLGISSSQYRADGFPFVGLIDAHTNASCMKEADYSTQGSCKQMCMREGQSQHGLRGQL